MGWDQEPWNAGVIPYFVCFRIPAVRGSWAGQVQLPPSPHHAICLPWRELGVGTEVHSFFQYFLSLRFRHQAYFWGEQIYFSLIILV